MKKIGFVVVVALTAWTGAAARTMYSVQPVVNVELSGSVWNLTECEPVGSEVDYRVDVGDTVRVWSPDTRFDFVNRGDSVLQTCTETRAYRALFSPGIARQLGSGGSSSFAVKGRVYQSGYIAGEGMAMVDSQVDSTIIVMGGDTIGGARLHHDVVTMRWTISGDSLLDISALPDSLLATTVIDSYRLMAPGETFPRAVKRVKQTMADGRVVERDSMAWVLSYTPSIEAARATKSMNNLLTNSRGSDPGDLNPDGSTSDIKVFMDGDGVTVSSPTSMGAKVVITDMIGRLYYVANMQLTPAGTLVATDSLPRGEYLLQIIPADGTPTRAVKLVL